MPSDGDYEMNSFNMKEDSLAPASSWSMRRPSSFGAGDQSFLEDVASSASHRRRQQMPPQTAFMRWVDTFRQDTGSSVTRNIMTRGGDNRSSFAGTGSTVGSVLRGRPPDLEDGEGPRGRFPSREHLGNHYYDLRAANRNTASTMLARELKGRHLQMIAIGGSIGWLISFFLVNVLPSSALLSVISFVTTSFFSLMLVFVFFYLG
jgi:amino acid transporter